MDLEEMMEAGLAKLAAEIRGLTSDTDEQASLYRLNTARVVEFIQKRHKPGKEFPPNFIRRVRRMIKPDKLAEQLADLRLEQFSHGKLPDPPPQYQQYSRPVAWTRGASHTPGGTASALPVA